ncbi:HAD-IA family hydrolase [Rhodohalobacter sp. SW132]|nr:HAD-IA family hydrolase [Rhodohalobacter sp. SW132]
MSRSYDAVIFDMDGVIIDSKELVESFWIENMKKYGIEIPKGDELELRFHGRPARLTVNDLFADLPESTREEIIEECARFDASVEKFKMIPGVEPFMKKCADSGIRLGLVTSALPEKVDRMLAGLSYPSPFDVRITADLVQNGKPDPECYLTAAQGLDVDPGRMIVFEDSISGVKAASEAGATVIGINEEHLSGPLLDAGAMLVIPNFSDAKLIHGELKVTIYPGSGHRENSFEVKKPG